MCINGSFLHIRLYHVSQAFERPIPACRDAVQKDLCFFQPLWFQRIAYFATMPLVLHQPDPFQHLQMLDDGLARNMRVHAKACGRLRALFNQPLYKGKPGGIAKRREHIGNALVIGNGLINHARHIASHSGSALPSRPYSSEKRVRDDVPVRCQTRTR